MDADKPRVDSAAAVGLLCWAAIVFALICVLMNLVFFAITGGEWRPLVRGLPGMLVFESQLFAVGVMGSTVLAVSGTFPEHWKLSADVWILVGLLASLGTLALLLRCEVPYLRPSTPWPWSVLLGGSLALWGWIADLSPAILCAPLIAGALAVWTWVRVRDLWRWPGARVGHVLAAAAVFVYGGLLSTLAFLKLWSVGVVVAGISAYAVCYVLGLVTLRADEFEAACRSDAGPRAEPSVRLTALLLLLSIGCSGALALVVPWQSLLHPPKPLIIY